jgi:hypothetical protein
LRRKGLFLLGIARTASALPKSISAASFDSARTSNERAVDLPKSETRHPWSVWRWMPSTRHPSLLTRKERFCDADKTAILHDNTIKIVDIGYFQA